MTLRVASLFAGIGGLPDLDELKMADEEGDDDD